jgi:NCS2 family nucleobase:cation symporter-2
LSEPTTLAYGLEDRPPILVSLASALQLVAVVAVLALNVLLVGQEAGLDPEGLSDLVRASFLAIAVGTVLQAQRWGRRFQIGSGFLCASSISAVYIPPAILALRAGGMALVCGMIVCSGLLLMVLSRAMHRLRAVLSGELVGVVVVLVGLSVGFTGLRLCITPTAQGTMDASRLDIAGLALGIMVFLRVWGRGAAALLCALIGVAAGYAAAFALGVLPQDLPALLAEAKWVALPPISHAGLRFDLNAALPFAVATIATVVTTMATILTAQRVNDPEWQRPDQRSIEGGVLSDGVATVISGLLGTLPVVASGSSVSLSAATGVTSRRVAYSIAGILLVMACSPKFALVFESTPQPVVGAMLLFAATFIVVNGIQIVATRLLDARRSLTVGFACCIGLASAVYPELFLQLPAMWRPLASSPLLLGTVVALALSAVFRIGIHRAETLQLEPDQALEGVETFLMNLGASWGARRDVMQRAVFAMSQAVETVRDIAAPGTPVRLKVGYDELRLSIEVAYRGPAPILSDTPPSEAEILEDDGDVRLAGYMLRRAADRMRSSQRNGETMLRFDYDH